MKNKVKKVFEKIKYGFMYNKITTLLSAGLIILLFVLCFTNGIFGSGKDFMDILDDMFWVFLLVPIAYRFVGSFILKMLVKAGMKESTDYFAILTRIAVMITCFIIFIIAGAGIGNTIFFGILIGYLDKFIFFLIQIFAHISIESYAYGNTSNINDVGSLVSNSKNSYQQPDGTVVYKDSTGKTIGSSKFDEKTGETIYWNENMGYIGKSIDGGNNSKEFYDKDINYKGKSIKETNGTTTYYDEKSNYKGKSKSSKDNTTYYEK